MLKSIKNRLYHLKKLNSESNLKEIEKVIQLSGLFNEEWYFENNPDVKNASLNPIRHYIEFGAKEGRNPSPTFNNCEYIATTPDVVLSGLNPLYHYIKYGNNKDNKGLSNSSAQTDTTRVETINKSISLGINHAANRLKKTLDLFPRGSIDSLNDGNLSGWFQNESIIDEFKVHLWLDDVILSHNIKPNILRSDVKELHGGQALCGFKIDLSAFPLTHSSILSLREAKNGTHICSKVVKEIFLDVGKAQGNHFNKLDLLMANYDAHRVFLNYFDASYYLMENSDIAKSGTSPLRHYLYHGYAELRRPGHTFDAIWYTHTYMNSDWSKDALFHYAMEGFSKGNLAAPLQSISFKESVKYSTTQSAPKRICLFAGYDSDGIIDDVVIEFISEMAKFADVYYLADCSMPKTELNKLQEITKGAWAERHGRYDFGSWSRLAKELVGWDVIDSYDEMILTNDSSYLVRTFDSVFKRMDETRCDWWGLQATKGIHATFLSQGITEKVSLKEIKKNWLSHFESDKIYDFLVGSYFLVYRKPVLNNTIFRSILNNVQTEDSKALIIHKYEIGLTRFLISQGHDFSTYEENVYPCQPVYSEMSFDLIHNGFPLLKKYHLIENHYEIDELWRWKEKLREAGIDKDLTPYIKNLQRTGNAQSLYRSMDVELFNITPPMQEEELLAEDLVTPKYDSWWCFPVCAYSHRFNDNLRALFEEIKNDSKIKKIILTRTKNIELDGKNVVIFPLFSREGQYYLLRSRHIFLKHGVKANINVNLSAELHAFHNLWHGIPLKRIGYASIDQQQNLSKLSEQNNLLRSVICASKVDQLAMASAYWPLTINDIWLTGLPRHDLILKDEILLAIDMKEQLQQLRSILDGRKLILFAPTFKNNQEHGYYKFTEKELAQLANVLRKNNCVLGVREHMADKSHQYSSQLFGDSFIAVPENVFPNVEILMRDAVALITDYSSVFIDFLITGRPVISFAYDYEHYTNEERGLFYDLDWSFPGKIAKDFSSLIEVLHQALSSTSEQEKERYMQRRKLFIDHIDCNNSLRVVKCINNLDLKDITIFDKKELPLSFSSPTAILWIYDRGHEITARYRIFNLMNEINSMGWNGKAYASDELTVEDVLQAGTLIFSRVKATDEIMDLVEGAKRRGVRIIFDIDDLIFDIPSLRQSEYYCLRPERRADIRYTVKGYIRLMEAADVLSVSTHSLKEYAKKFSKKIFVIPNSIGTGLINQYTNIIKIENLSTKSGIKICYLAGTQTHGSDFELIQNSALKIMQKYPDVEFHVVGNVSYNMEKNDALLYKWFRHPVMSYEKLHSFLSQMNINLAPLTKSTFNDCKSELKIFEAGLHSIPTIASPSASYSACLTNGINGFLAHTTDEWYQLMENLIKNAELRNKSGEEAKKLTLEKFSSKFIAQIYINSLLMR